MISEKMKLAAEDEAAKEFVSPIAAPMLRAGIDAAWDTLDPEDVKTWPKSEYAPSGNPWLILVDGGFHPILAMFTGDDGFRNVIMCSHAYYADPANFFPSFDNKRPKDTDNGS
ncbi:MAG: hypothetical protein JKY52_00045 [Flavobacteriales bacterium]|nr:hypothetical protein [Flavobacteriales bacterium]